MVPSLPDPLRGPAGQTVACPGSRSTDLPARRLAVVDRLVHNSAARTAGRETGEAQKRIHGTASRTSIASRRSRRPCACSGARAISRRLSSSSSTRCASLARASTRPSATSGASSSRCSRSLPSGRAPFSSRPARWGRPRTSLRRFFERTLLEVPRARAARGCMMVNTVLELAEVDPELSAVAASELDIVEALFAEVIADADATTNGSARSSLPVSERAAQVMLLNQGLRVEESKTGAARSAREADRERACADRRGAERLTRRSRRAPDERENRTKGGEHGVCSVSLREEIRLDRRAEDRVRRGRGGRSDRPPARQPDLLSISGAT